MLNDFMEHGPGATRSGWREPITAACMAFALLLLAPAGAQAQLSVAPEPGFQSDLPAAAYYRATRPDHRRCISPLCGGVFVKLVNRAYTKCTDGEKARDCYAGIIDLSALGLDPEREARVRAGFESGEVLARGRLVERASEFGVTVATLVVTDAWRGVTGNEPKGRFWGVTQSGIVCVTWPCPSFFEQMLNRKKSGLVDEVDLTYSEGTPEQIEQGWQALSSDALLIAGGHRMIVGPAGKGMKLIAAEFYVRVPAGSGEPRACGGFTYPPLPACERGEWCEPPAATCRIADVPGTCVDRPEACPEIYSPVCGCDGRTYPNDCERSAAQVGLDHDGPCDTRDELCGKSVCAEGTVCCNPLLGICTPPGVACIQ